MPYRQRAVPESPEQNEMRELRDLNDAALGRLARVRKIVVAVVLGGVVAGIFAASLAKPRPRTVCHEVQIRYENAPEIPPGTFTSCREL